MLWNMEFDFAMFSNMLSLYELIKCLNFCSLVRFKTIKKNSNSKLCFFQIMHENLICSPVVESRDFSTFLNRTLQVFLRGLICKRNIGKITTLGI